MREEEKEEGLAKTDEKKEKRRKERNGIREEEKESPTRVLILASEDPRCFCAGADLKERRGMTTLQ